MCDLKKKLRKNVKAKRSEVKKKNILYMLFLTILNFFENNEKTYKEINFNYIYYYYFYNLIIFLFS